MSGRPGDRARPAVKNDANSKASSSREKNTKSSSVERPKFRETFKAPSLPAPSRLKKSKDKDRSLCLPKQSSLDVDDSVVFKNSSNACLDLKRKFEVNDLLETLYMDALVDEVEERQRDHTDTRLTELGKLLEINKFTLEKINQRLIDLAFLCKQQSTLDRKSRNVVDFAKATEASGVEDILENLNSKGRKYCDRLEVKNVDTGYTASSGFKELNLALAETIRVFDEIKKERGRESNDEAHEIDAAASDLVECREMKDDIDCSIKKYDHILPKVCDNLIRDTSEKLAKVNIDMLDVVLPSINNGKF